MSGHTPGPWSATYGHLIRVSPTNNPSTICGVHRRGLHSGNYDEAEVFANARLIAAAPDTAAERDRLKEINDDLLAACKSVREWLMEPFTAADADDENLSPAFRKALRKVNAAIAKAEGS